MRKYLLMIFCAFAVVGCADRRRESIGNRELINALNGRVKAQGEFIIKQRDLITGLRIRADLMEERLKDLESRLAMNLPHG